MDNTKVLDDSANGKRFYKKCINFLGILAFGGVGEGVQVLVRLVCGKLFIDLQRVKTLARIDIVY